MFKKPLSNTKTSAPLRSSDRRKLKQRIIQTYGLESPELGDLLVPDGLMSQKVATYANDPAVIYLSPEGEPLWFTIGKDSTDLIPTVYTLWKKYDLLPWISTPASVIPILVGGADLMIPGVVQVSSSVVSPQELITVVQHTDESTSTCGPPLAVGRLAVDLDTLKAGEKGKAVNVLHTWKDHLFDTGGKSDPPGEIELKANVNKDDGAPTSEPGGTVGIQQSAPDAVTNDPSGTNSAAVSASATNISTSVPSEPALPKEEVSEILRTAVLQAIATTLNSLTSASFPIPASTFYSSYILPFRPAFPPKSSSDEQSRPSPGEVLQSYPQIDIKHSSHKSLLAFFKLLDKQQILTLKDMKPEPLVLNVSATHPDVVAHRPYTSLRDVQVKEEKKEKREEEERRKVREMEVRELWKPHAASGSAKFFTDGGFDSSALYSYSELKSTVNGYISTRQLVNARDQSYINVGTDEVLLSTVCAKGEAPESIEFLKRDDVVRRLSEKMQNWYEIRSEGKDPVLRKGQLKPISIVVKVRQGRRATTLVTGFEPFSLDGEEMADELRRLCACATSVSPAPGKASGLEVFVQGKHLKTVTDFLLSRGVPKKWIDSVDLTGKNIMQLTTLFAVPYPDIVWQSVPPCLALSFHGIHGNQAVFKPESVCVSEFAQTNSVAIPLPTSNAQLVWLQESAIDATLRTTAYGAEVADFFQWVRSDPSDYQTVLLAPPVFSLLHHDVTLGSALISVPDESAVYTLSNLLPRYWTASLIPLTPLPILPVPEPALAYIRALVASAHFDPIVATIVDGVSVDGMRKDVRYLTNEDGASGIQSRHSFAGGARVAAAWLKTQFEQAGATCELRSFSEDLAPNVVCDYASVVDSKSIVLISAHYDSRGSFGSPRAPGANDDGSGIISLLAIARRIEELGVKFHTNVRLVAFAGEEQGLLGSKAYARVLREQNTNVTLMIQADMLAYHVPGEPHQLGLSRDIGSREVANLITKMAEIYSPELSVGYTTACCSDHRSFHEQGYAAMQVFERAGPIADPMYHNSDDVSERPGFDFEQIQYISRVQFATLLHTAGFQLS